MLNGVGSIICNGRLYRPSMSDEVRDKLVRSGSHELSDRAALMA